MVVRPVAITYVSLRGRLSPGAKRRARELVLKGDYEVRDPMVDVLEGKLAAICHAAKNISRARKSFAKLQSRSENLGLRWINGAR
jgi:hypothetical protein